MSEEIGEDATRRINERLNQFMRESGLLPATTAPSYRYFQGANGNMYCWTTERADQTDDDPKGWYASFIYRAYGPGSRSGKANRWKPDMKTMRRHRKRKDAKARALKMLRRDNPA